LNRLLLYMVLLLALCISLGGCRPYTWTNGATTFPPGSTTNYKAKVFVGVKGAPGHAYVEETEKQVHFWLTGGKHRVQRDFTLVAACLDWKVTWEEFGDVEIELYDWGPSLTETSAREKDPSAAPRVIKRLHFVLDPESGEFVDRSDDQGGIPLPVGH